MQAQSAFITRGSDPPELFVLVAWPEADLVCQSDILATLTPRQVDRLIFDLTAWKSAREEAPPMVVVVPGGYSGIDRPVDSLPAQP